MRRWLRGTFGLVAAVALGFALATLAIGVVAFETTHEALELQLDHRIAIETQALIDEGQDGHEGVAAAIRRREAASSTASLGYRLVDAANNPVAGALDATVPAKPGYVELLPYKAGGEERIAQSLTTILPGEYRLLVAADRAAIDEMDIRFIQLFLGAFGAMLLLGIAAAWLVGLVTRRRLARIDHTAAAIIDGDLSRRVPLSGSGDEFDGVAETLNLMLDRALLQTWGTAARRHPVGGLGSIGEMLIEHNHGFGQVRGSNSECSFNQAHLPHDTWLQAPCLGLSFA